MINLCDEPAARSTKAKLIPLARDKPAHSLRKDRFFPVRHSHQLERSLGAISPAKEIKIVRILCVYGQAEGGPGLPFRSALEIIISPKWVSCDGQPQGLRL